MYVYYKDLLVPNRPGHIFENLLLRQIPNIFHQARPPKLHNRLIDASILQHCVVQLDQDILGDLEIIKDIRCVVYIEPREIPVVQRNYRPLLIPGVAKKFERYYLFQILPSTHIFPGMVVHPYRLHYPFYLADLKGGRVQLNEWFNIRRGSAHRFQVIGKSREA